LGLLDVNVVIPGKFLGNVASAPASFRVLVGVSRYACHDNDLSFVLFSFSFTVLALVILVISFGIIVLPALFLDQDDFIGERFRGFVVVFGFLGHDNGILFAPISSGMAIPSYNRFFFI
jgi:hypothetical protein